MTDIELLARLIKCEAGGEGNVGMAAVATVIMNRVYANMGEYGRFNSIPDVIYAPRQFECLTHGSQNIYNMRPEALHYAIAEWAIAGNKLPSISEALWFYSPQGAECRNVFPNENGQFLARIGDHCFYAPTSSYVNT